jgi:hypothetical protein
MRWQQLCLRGADGHEDRRWTVRDRRHLALEKAGAGGRWRLRAPDGPLGRRPALDILRIVEAHQVSRLLVRSDPELPTLAAQARVGSTLGHRFHVAVGRAEQAREVAAGVAHVPISLLLRPDEQEGYVRPRTVVGALERLNARHGHTVARLVLPHADEMVLRVSAPFAWLRASRRSRVRRPGWKREASSSRQSAPRPHSHSSRRSTVAVRACSSSVAVARPCQYCVLRLDPAGSGRTSSTTSTGRADVRCGMEGGVEQTCRADQLRTLAATGRADRLARASAEVRRAGQTVRVH